MYEWNNSNSGIEIVQMNNANDNIYIYVWRVWAGCMSGQKETGLRVYVDWVWQYPEHLCKESFPWITHRARASKAFKLITRSSKSFHYRSSFTSIVENVGISDDWLFSQIQSEFRNSAVCVRVKHRDIHNASKILSFDNVMPEHRTQKQLWSHNSNTDSFGK